MILPARIIFFSAGYFFHPLYCFTIHSFCKQFRVHTESGTEHFRKNNHFCFFFNAFNFLRQHTEVCFFIFPMEIGLNKSDCECIHQFFLVVFS